MCKMKEPPPPPWVSEICLGNEIQIKGWTAGQYHNPLPQLRQAGIKM